MQLLVEASKSRAQRPRDDHAAECAGAILQGVPPAIWFIRRHMRDNRAAGLSIPQFRALMRIARNPSASLSDIADHLGVSQPSASRLISGLVSRGFVTRDECATDRRQITLTLTARGRTIRSKSQEATQAKLAEAIAHLPARQQQVISEAMEILHQVFGHTD
jgi:DNA-binding MarR family transcriptional regulator